MSATKIYEYIQSKKYAPARNLINAELDKDPQSIVYKSLEAFLAYKLNNRQTALDIVKQALNSRKISPPVVTTIIAPILLAYNEAILLSQAFEQANRKASSEKPLVSAWIECALIMGDIKMLCKALLANNKQQQSRKSAFQTCFALYMVWSISAPGDTERKLYPTLASKMLEAHLPAKTNSEFYAHAMVVSMSGKLAPMVIEHPTFSHSLDTTQAVLEELEADKEWEVLYDYCIKRLDRIDSFNFWQSLNTAAVALDKQTEVRDYNKKFSSNNSRLALVDLAEKTSSGLLSELKSYWVATQTKLCAYEYLKPYLEVDGFYEFLVDEDPRDFTAAVNLIKLKYVVEPSVNVKTLVDLYQENLDEIPAEATDYFVGSDLLMLAAIQLLKQNETVNALVLLEYASSKDPSNFYVRLWLLHLYRHFGVMPLALAQYQKMTIKNLQHESLGHLIVTRGGTLGVPAKQFANMKKMYEQSENMFSASNLALEDQVYCQLPGMLELQRRMNCSLTRMLLNLGELQTMRVSRGETDISHVINSPSTIIDNRDFNSFFDPLNELPELGLEPKVDEKWVRGQLARERGFLNIIRGVDDPLSIDTTGFTEAEKWSLDCLKQNKLMALPLKKDAFTWEFVHTNYCIVETMKLLTDMSLKSGNAKVNFKQEKAVHKEFVKHAVEFLGAQTFQSSKEWAKLHHIPAEGTITNLVKMRIKTLEECLTAIR